jgi:hypothetical protein
MHGLIPYPVKSVQSLQKKRPASGLPVQACGLNETSPTLAGLVSSTYLRIADRM